MDWENDGPPFCSVLLTTRPIFRKMTLRNLL